MIMDHDFGGNFRQDGFTYCGTSEHAGIVEKGGACPKCGKGILMLVKECVEHYSHGMFHKCVSRYYLCMECGAVYGPVSATDIVNPTSLPFERVEPRGDDRRLALELTADEDGEARLTLIEDGEFLGAMCLNRESVCAWVDALSSVRDAMKEDESE